jgi:hypothetical protein
MRSAPASIDALVPVTAEERVTAVIAGDRDRRTTGQRNSHDAGAQRKRDAGIGPVATKGQIFDPDRRGFGV